MPTRPLKCLRRCQPKFVEPLLVGSRTVGSNIWPSVRSLYRDGIGLYNQLYIFLLSCCKSGIFGRFDCFLLEDVVIRGFHLFAQIGASIAEL